MIVYPNTDDSIKRLGYRGFLSAVLMLWRMNRSARILGVSLRCEIVLPVRWLR